MLRFAQTTPVDAPPAGVRKDTFHGPACGGNLGDLVERAIPTKAHIAPNMESFVVKLAPGETDEAWNDSWVLLASHYDYPPGTSIEYAVPVDEYVDVLDEMLVQMRHLYDMGACCVGPVSVRLSRASTAFLAMSHGGDHVTIEVLAAMGNGRTAMHGGEGALDDLGRFFLRRTRSARPHWGQQLPGNLPEVASRYPAFPRWMAARNAIDPHGFFLHLRWT